MEEAAFETIVVGVTLDGDWENDIDPWNEGNEVFLEGIGMDDVVVNSAVSSVNTFSSTFLLGFYWALVVSSPWVILSGPV
jgi:hypothetical protein